MPEIIEPTNNEASGPSIHERLYKESLEKKERMRRMESKLQSLRMMQEK